MTETLRPAFPDIAEDERPYTKVSYGLPFDQACKKHVDGFLNVNKVYIIASKSLAAQTDNLKKLETTLGDKHVGTWLGIAAHTPYDALAPIIADMRAKQADCLVTMGGGSLADGAKAIVYALANKAYTLEEITALGETFNGPLLKHIQPVGAWPKVKLIFMPTTLSGAEFSRFAGCTRPSDKLKIQWTHPGMFAHLLILDSTLCKSTPDWVWKSTGVRAIDHCIENTCSTNAHPESDKACARALVDLVLALFTDKEDPGNLDARLQAQLGCNGAMTGLALLVFPGASHGIGHQLGPLGIGHGQTSCILLPAVMKVNAPYTQAQQDKLKQILWSEPRIVAVLEAAKLKSTSDLGDALRAIFNHLGMPSSLKEVGIGRDKWESLEVNSLEDDLVRHNPKPMKTREGVREVLELVSGDA